MVTLLFCSVFNLFCNYYYYPAATLSSASSSSFKSLRSPLVLDACMAAEQFAHVHACVWARKDADCITDWLTVWLSMCCACLNQLSFTNSLNDRQTAWCMQTSATELYNPETSSASGYSLLLHASFCVLSMYACVRLRVVVCVNCHRFLLALFIYLFCFVTLCETNTLTILLFSISA